VKPKEQAVVIVSGHRALRRLIAGLVALITAACAEQQVDDTTEESPAPVETQPEDVGGQTQSASAASTSGFTMRVVTQGLESPWEVTWGPDGYLWITERVAKRVVRVDPATGARTTALRVSSVYVSSGQDGLLGMALHPKLLQGQNADYVYLAYTYDADTGSAIARRTKLVRYTYDVATKTLRSPIDLLTWLPASSDHNSGRLRFGPDGRLYLTVGDLGKNQFENRCSLIRAQELPTQQEIAKPSWARYQGKVLRINPNGSIPADNPVLAGVRSHIYSYGHRNAQGIAFGPQGLIYVSEQGPKTDDELNLIEAGKNYGWPYVAGYRDDKAYVYGNWSASSPVACDTLTFSDYVLPPSVPQQPEHAFTHPDFRPPLLTFYTVHTGYNFRNAACSSSPYICWPTIAPSSLDIYVAGSGAIPGWGTSLLVPSLKQGSVFRVGLSADGRSVTNQGVAMFKTTNRYRDLTIGPDKRTFYVITDSQGDTSGPTQGSTQNLEHRGAVLAFRYAL